MNKFIKLISLLLIITLIAGCINSSNDKPVPISSVEQTTIYKVLKIDGVNIYYYDENSNIKSRIIKEDLYIIESNNTRLEQQYYNSGLLQQWILYINITN